MEGDDEDLEAIGQRRTPARERETALGESPQ